MGSERHDETLPTCAYIGHRADKPRTQVAGWRASPTKIIVCAAVMIAARPTCQVGIEWAEPGIFAQQIYQAANVGRFPYPQLVFEQRDE